VRTKQIPAWVYVLCGLLLSGSGASAQERSLAQLYEVGGGATWAFELAGERFGEHHMRYGGAPDPLAPDVLVFECWTRLGPTPGLPVEQRYRARLWCRGDGQPLRHELQAQIGTQYSSVDLSFGEESVSALVVQGRQRTELEQDIPAGSMVQGNNLIGWFELVYALRAPPREERSEVPLYSSNILRTLTYRMRWREERADGAQVYSDSLGERVAIDAEGHLLDLEVASQELLVRRTDEPFEPFELGASAQEPDERFEVEEVVIEHGATRLAGSVTRARGLEGRLPALMFVSGSGVQDRDGRSALVDVGTWELLDRLTLEGYLVLRVDDRGSGGSAGPMEDLGFDELVSDARACLEYLLARDDVDANRVGVIGHSEGGVTAPLLALEHPELAAVVLMAAPGRSLHEVIMDQNRRALVKAGVQGEELEQQLAAVSELLGRLASEAEVDPLELPPDQRSLVTQRSWLQDHARQDPAATIARVRTPVLVMQGELDFQVSAQRDARALNEALLAADHPDHELVVLPGLDHLFKRVEGAESTLAEYFEDRSLDPLFLDTLCQWLGARMQPSEDG